MIYLKKSWYIPLILLGLLSACSKDNLTPELPPVTPGPVSSVPSTINTPSTINLLLERENGVSYRLVMPIIQMGSKKVSIRTVFDTGSEGLILDASTLLPPEMITDAGIVMNGKSSIVVNDITITSTLDSASYGDTQNTIRHYYGNLAYSTVVMGDDAGNLTTRKMPFLLIYKGVDAKNMPAKIDKDYDGICGVNSAYVSNSDLAVSKKQLKSPFDYMNYLPGIHSGFMLSPLNADPVYGDGLFTKSVLTVGVTDDMESGFSIYQQDLLLSGTYSPAVPVTVSWNDHVINTKMLFDTGTPLSFILLDPKFDRQQKLPDYTQVNYSILDFSYSYTTFGKLYPTYSGPGKRSIVCLRFFDKFYYFLDYQKHTIGFLHG